jgi:tetratricopeptide (TPR) repeat protein
VAGLYYAYLAIHGLMAADQKQQAINLIAALASPGQTSSINAVQTLAVNELVQILVKAGDVETALAVPERIQPPLDPKALPGVRNTIVTVVIRTLAEAGKTDQALMMIADKKSLTEAQITDLQTAVGQAFAKRGDSRLAQSSYDQAEKSLETARRYAAGSSVQLQLASIRLLALRGKADAVNAALQQLKSDPAATDPRPDYARSLGYQCVVTALLEAKQAEPALAIAKSLTPDTTRDSALAGIAVWYATNGRLADARALLASMGTAAESTRTAVVRTPAVATAKQGDAAAALKLADEVHNPLNRRGTLLAIAQALPQ